MRILLDANVLIAAVATRGLCRDVLQIVLAEHHLLVGKTNLDELERILKNKLRMPSHRIQEVVAFVEEHAEVVSPHAPASWPEADLDDRCVVSAVLDGSADLLVTGDKNPIVAASGENLRVITPRGFWEQLNRSD